MLSRLSIWRPRSEFYVSVPMRHQHSLCSGKATVRCVTFGHAKSQREDLKNSLLTQDKPSSVFSLCSTALKYCFVLYYR